MSMFSALLVAWLVMFWSMSRARKERASYSGAEGARVRLEVLFNTNIRWMVHYVASLEIARSWTANHNDQ